MTDEYFYVKKGAISIECDEDEIVVIRRGTKHFFGHLCICVILVLIAITLTICGLMYSRPDEKLIILMITLGLDLIAFGILAAVLSIREKVTLDEEGLHVHYNWFRRSICRFIPLRELGDFVRWTTRNKVYYSGIKMPEYDTFEVHARTLGNRVCFAYCRKKEHIEMIAVRLHRRMEDLRAAVADDPQAERCLLRAGKSAISATRGDIPPLSIARNGKPQNLIPIEACRWNDEIDEYGDLVLSNSKNLKTEHVIIAGVGTLFFLGLMSYWFLNHSWKNFGNDISEHPLIFTLLWLFAVCGLFMTMWLLLQIVVYFHRSRWCFSKNGSVECTHRLFGIPRHRYYENGMRFTLMVISDDYGTKKYDEFNYSDDRWELVFYDAAKDRMFRIESLYRGEAHWLADQILKFCNADS